MKKIQHVEGDTLYCPYCGKTEDDKVEDYVVRALIGKRNKSQCGWCDEYFYVTETSKDVFVVEE